MWIIIIRLMKMFLWAVKEIHYAKNIKGTGFLWKLIINVIKTPEDHEISSVLFLHYQSIDSWSSHLVFYIDGWHRFAVKMSNSQWLFISLIRSTVTISNNHERGDSSFNENVSTYFKVSALKKSPVKTTGIPVKPYLEY